MSMLVLPDITLTAIQAEATRAHLRHGDHSMLGTKHTDASRLAILGEETGEAHAEALAMAMDLHGRATALGAALGRVAHELTYDSGGGADERKTRLVLELIQVSAMSACWAQHLEEGS